MKKTINKEPLYFVDYGVHYDGDDEHYKEKFSTMNVRKLNITQDELTHILKVIQSWSHFRNSDGTLVLGRDLTILPSKTMDMEMDVNEDNVSIKNNRLWVNNPLNSEPEKIMRIVDYLYGGTYVGNCWDYSKTEEGQKSRNDSWKEIKNKGVK